MRGPGSWPLYVVPLLLVGIGLATVHFDGFRQYRDYVGDDRIPETLVRSGRTGKELRLLEYKPLSGMYLQNFERELRPGDMPSTTALDDSVISGGLPILSVAVDSKDLLDRDTGLLANPLKRGRAWERPAYATYFRDGQLVFATGAGLRVHGGKSRAMTQKSFRLHFRNIYGVDAIPLQSVFPDDEGLVRSLVVHNDVRFKRTASSTTPWHFTNPIAYEVARRIGCITPDTQPVAFYLNGVYQGAYVLTEHVSTDFIVNQFGHDDFVFADTRLDTGASGMKLGSQKHLDEIERWLKDAPSPLGMDDVASRVDLRNLMNWFISVLYAGTTDPFQGAIARDKSAPDGRWFWINWDMDHSFMDLYSQVENPWQIDNFAGRNPILQSKDSRALIFNRLRTESPEFRIAFLNRLTEVLNHDLDESFMQGLIDRYEKSAVAFSIEDRSNFDIMRAYASQRPGVLRAQMDTYFNAGPSYRLTVHESPPAHLRIDSREVTRSFTGWYFTDTPARIEVTNVPSGKTIYWIVNGIEHSSGDSELELRLTMNTSIEIVLR